MEQELSDNWKNTDRQLPEIPKTRVFGIFFIPIILVSLGFLGSWSDLMLFPLFIGAPLFLLWQIVLLIRTTLPPRHHEWRRRCIEIFTAFVTVVLILGSLVSWGDELHFALMYPAYRIAVAKEPTRSISFSWSGQGMVGSSETDRAVIYDPTDDLSHKLGSQNLVADKPDSVFGYRTTNHLYGHFYLVQLHWP